MGWVKGVRLSRPCLPIMVFSSSWWTWTNYWDVSTAPLKLDGHERKTYTTESSADLVLLHVVVVRRLALATKGFAEVRNVALATKDLAGVLDDLAKALETSFNILDVQALLAGLQRALVVHSGDVFGDHHNDALEALDHFLQAS